MKRNIFRICCCAVLAVCIAASSAGCSLIPGISKVDNNGNSASAVEGTEYVEMEDNVCGDSATFTLSKDGVLTISGSGSIYDSDKHLFGWAFYKDDIKKIIVENGITSIGDGAFNDCQAEEVEIADTVT